MKPTAWFAALAAMTASCDALAVGDVAQVTIIDRSTGAVLTPHLHQGEYWVAGRPGTTYAIEIHNHLDERVLAVTSVDGVNVISGATAAWNQTGYVFRPQQNYRITGWRKSDDEVAAFTFTASPNSYAARTGRPANVGVIGVAVFRERQQLNLPPPCGLRSSAPATASANIHTSTTPNSSGDKLNLTRSSASVTTVSTTSSRWASSPGPAPWPRPPTPFRPRPNSVMSRILRQRCPETLYSLKSVKLSGVGITLLART